MKILNVLFILISIFVYGTISLAASEDFPIPRLKGRFFYQDHFEVQQIRRAETVPSETLEGQKRIQELRAQGYSCIRKNPVTRLCSKTWKPESAPAGIDESVKKFMTGISVEFEGSAEPPVLVHDGSTSQEWEVSEIVQVMQTKMTLYRVVRTNKNQIFVAFPVSEEQPMNPLRFHSAKALGLSVIANSKDTETSTVAYTIEALLETAENWPL